MGGQDSSLLPYRGLRYSPSPCGVHRETRIIILIATVAIIPTRGIACHLIKNYEA